MAYQALYRKWRPSVFEDVVGQKHIVDTLKNQINTNKIAHAYLFCGSRGTGKTSTAKIFSRAVNCLNPVNGNPCNECETCKGILNNSIFDVVEIDGASNNKVDDIRNIRDEVVYPPADSKYKVYIIDEVHMLTTEAFNALLKTLEEPPAYVIFILATTEFHKIPATIISRCQKFDFKRITYNDTADRIRKVAASDNIDVTESAVKLIAKAADGSLRDGLSKLDQCLALGLTKIDYKDVAGIIGASDPEFLSDLCDAIIDERTGDALKLLDNGVNMGVDPLRLFTDVIDYFRDLMMIKTSNDFSLIINTEQEVVDRYNKQCEKLSLSRLLKIIETLFEGQNISKYLASPKLSFETCILKIASKNTNADIDVLLERLEMLENKLNKIEQGNIVIHTQSVKETETIDEKDKIVEMVETPDTIIEPEIKENTEALTYEINDDDEEYSFPSYEEENGEMEAYFDFAPPPEISEEYINNEKNIDVSESVAVDNEVVESSDNDSNEIEKLASYLKLNFKDFSVNVKNKDIAFDSIMLSAEITSDDNGMIFIFDNKTKLDIARNNKYDELIKDAISEVYNIELTIKLRGLSIVEEKETSENVDPFEELFQMAEQNQIIFNFEN